MKRFSPATYSSSASCKGGKATVAELHKDDLGLLDPSGDSGDAEGYMVQAGNGSFEL